MHLNKRIHDILLAEIQIDVLTFDVQLQHLVVIQHRISESQVCLGFVNSRYHAIF